MSRTCHVCICAQCLGAFRADGLDAHCKVPGVHDPLDPELSILKQRLARRLRHESELVLLERLEMGYAFVVTFGVVFGGVAKQSELALKVCAEECVHLL